jgi:hypothetical protein
LKAGYPPLAQSLNQPAVRREPYFIHDSHRPQTQQAVFCLEGSESMKVKDLIKYLEEQDPDSKIGFVDHFGEFHPATPYQIRSRDISALNKKNKNREAIVIEPPDFGPEPD